MYTRKALTVFILTFYLYISGEGLAEVKKEYYPSGKLMAERSYRYGKREGITRIYYESGKLRSEWNYKDGKQEGISREYYPNGEIKYVDTYKNGQRTNRKVYDEKGRLEFDQGYLYKEQ
jgi:antitoxin component YwqK of YwqJK toxin-antitoxin module